MDDSQDVDTQQFHPLFLSAVGIVGGTLGEVVKKLQTTDTNLFDLLAAELAKPHFDGIILGVIASPSLFNFRSAWLFGWTDEFRKQVDGIDRKMQGRILQAISEIMAAPVEPHGDTRKPLTKEERFRGCWRHRIGDYRVIYYPDPAEKRVLFVSFDARSNSYE